MADAGGDGDYSDGVVYELIDVGGVTSVRMSLDDGWLDDPVREWPVVVDPALGFFDTVDDTFVTEGDVGDHSGDPTLQVGFDGTAVSRAFVEPAGSLVDHYGAPYSTDPWAFLADKTILGGWYHHTLDSCPTERPDDIAIYAVTDPWSASGVTWANQPGLSPDPIGVFAGGDTTGSCTYLDPDHDEVLELRAWIPDAVRGWVDGTVPYHGVSLATTDETALSSHEFVASGPGVPAGQIDVWWSDPDAADAPDTPSELTPGGPVASLNPTLSARYHDTARPDEAGTVMFLIEDITDGPSATVAVFAGYGSDALDGDMSTMVYDSASSSIPLEWGRDYRLTAMSLRKLNTCGWACFMVDVIGEPDNASATITTTFTTTPVELTAPTDGATVFHTEDVTLTAVDGTSTIQQATLLVDDIAVDTISTAPWTFTWDTTTLPDGPHTLSAEVTLADASIVDTADSNVTIANGSGTVERSRIDLGRGLLTPDEFAIAHIDAIAHPQLLPARYAAGAVVSEEHGTAELLEGFAEVWEVLAPATKDQIRAQLTTSLTPGVPDPAFVANHGLIPMPGDPAYAGCGQPYWGWSNGTPGVWCSVQIEYRAEVCADPDMVPKCEGASGRDEVPTLQFLYTVGTGADSDVPGDFVSIDTVGIQVPERIAEYAANLFVAFEGYEDLGFELPGNLGRVIEGEEALVVAVAPVGRAFANPACFSCHMIPGLPDHGIALNPNDLAPNVRHEAFHIVQFAYVTEYDVLSEYLPGTAGRDSTLWWMEATAEWGEHRSQDSYAARFPGSQLDDLDSYARSIPAFLHGPARALGRFTGSASGPVPGSPQYGATLLAHYLEGRYAAGGLPFVRRTFEELREVDFPFFVNERTGLEVIHDVITDQGDVPSSVLADFWVASYGLEHSATSDSYKYLGNQSADLLADARARLDAMPDPDSLEGDPFSPVRRMSRVATPLTLLASGDTVTNAFDVEPGGVGVIDIAMEDDTKGSVLSLIDVADSDRADNYTAVLVAWAAASGGSGFPTMCYRNGQPYQDRVLLSDVNGVGLALDEACPTATLFVINHDPLDQDWLGGIPVDTITVNTQLQLPEPFEPAADGYAVVDGAPYESESPSDVVAFITNPPGAVPFGNQLCGRVEVAAGAGGGFFNYVGVDIYWVDLATGANISRARREVMPPGETIPYGIGPLALDPWVPPGVRVVGTVGEVTGYRAWAESC
jgi:hypothetical protein